MQDTNRNCAVPTHRCQPTRMPPREQLADAVSLSAALGHPAKEAIPEAISHEPLCVRELSVLRGKPFPALMHHLKMPGRVGFIEARKEGKFAVYHPVDPRAGEVLQAAHGSAPAMTGGTR